MEFSDFLTQAGEGGSGEAPLKMDPAARPVSVLIIRCDDTEP